MKSDRLKVIFAICVVLASAFFTWGQRRVTRTNEPSLIPFRKGDNWGFSDTKKKIVIKPIYARTSPFSEGLASVWSANVKCGYIDTKGIEVIPMIYDSCFSFSNGQAEVQLINSQILNSNKASRTATIDKRGRIIAGFRPWEEQTCAISLGTNGYLVCKRDGQVVPISTYLKHKGFSYGLSPVSFPNRDYSKIINGYIDPTGKLVFVNTYYPADGGFFFNGLALMRSQENEGSYGYINTHGKIGIPFKYDKATSFGDNVAVAKENGVWIIIDKAARKLTSLKYNYDEVYMPHGGTIQVRLKDKRNLIDLRGKEVYAVKQGYTLEPTANGLYLVGFIGPEGGVSWNNEFYVDANGTEYYEDDSSESRANGSVTETGYIDITEKGGGGCGIRVIAGEKSYIGNVKYQDLSSLTGQQIRNYDEALTFFDGKQISLTLTGLPSTGSCDSTCIFTGISQMTVLAPKGQRESIQTWNETTTATETIVGLSTDILFDFNKSNVNPNAIPLLIKLARLLRQSKSNAVQLNGFTDSIGTNEYNIDLSQRRAEAVRQWLISKGGIDGGRLITKGYGKEKPVAPNTNVDGSDSPEGRQKNRRVEIRIPKS